MNQNDLTEFKGDIQQLVNLTAALESAKEALGDRAKELQEKWEESEVFGIKAAQMKKAASMIYKHNLEEERAKANEIFELVEHIN